MNLLSIAYSAVLLAMASTAVASTGSARKADLAEVTAELVLPSTYEASGPGTAIDREVAGREDETQFIRTAGRRSP